MHTAYSDVLQLNLIEFLLTISYSKTWLFILENSMVSVFKDARLKPEIFF